MDIRLPDLGFEAERKKEVLMVVDFDDKTLTLEKNNTVINYYTKAPKFTNYWHFNPNGNLYIGFDSRLIDILLSRGAEFKVIDELPSNSIQEAYTSFSAEFYHLDAQN